MLVEILTKQGGSAVDASDISGWSSRAYTVFEGGSPVDCNETRRREKLVSILLEHGAAADFNDAKGRTMLSLAAGAGQIERARMFIEKGGTAGDLKDNARDGTGIHQRESTPRRGESANGKWSVEAALAVRNTGNERDPERSWSSKVLTKASSPSPSRRKPQTLISEEPPDKC